MSEQNSEYVPFGEEWKKEVSKLTKKSIIDLYRSRCKEVINLEGKLKAQLSAPNTGKPEVPTISVGDGWIKVEDGLPEFKSDMFTIRVLAFDGTTMKVASLFKQYDGRIDGYGTTGECYIRNVTHYKTLPPPPVEQKLNQ